MIPTGFTKIRCGKCTIEFCVPDYWYRTKKEDGSGWKCPNGHERIFCVESDEDKLRRERDLLKQQLAQRDDDLKQKDKEIAAQKGQVTKLKRRAAAGTCPCCKRTFSNMATHMRKQHPDFTPTLVCEKAS